MKLVSFEVAGRAGFGVWREDGVVDLGARLGPSVESLPGLIRSGRLAEARRLAETQAPDHALADPRLLKPLASWGKCFCVGVNYPERNAEYRDGSDRPAHPSLFVRFPESFVAHGEPILRPPESEQLDYEGEIVLVIGKPGRRIPEREAMGHVFGVTIANEGSVRDWVRHGKFNVTPGKNFASSGSMGPWIVPVDDLPTGPIRVITRVNGEMRQDDTADRMMFPFARIISYVSSFCTLEPGDVICTGTPTGAGARFDPPRYLKAGDRVEVEVPGVGILSNPVADEVVDASVGRAA